MRRRNPDARGLDAINAPEPPENRFEAALWRLAHREGDPDKIVAWAWEIYSELSEREVLQAFVLARASDEEVFEILKVPPPVTQAYRHLFFDVGMFRDELHLLSWIDHYESGKIGSQKGGALLRKALMGGVPALRWIYGRGDAAPDPMEVQRQVMTDAYYRGQAHRMYDLGSNEMKAAFNLLNTSAKIAATFTKRGDTSGIGALAIKLRHREMTSGVDEAEDTPLH